jgi:hypothetical protein
MFSETTGLSPFFVNYGFHPRLGVEPIEPADMPAARQASCNDQFPVTCLRGSGQPCHGWAEPRTMRFPHIRDAPVAEAKRQRSVFVSPTLLIAG